MISYVRDISTLFSLHQDLFLSCFFCFRKIRVPKPEGEKGMSWEQIEQRKGHKSEGGKESE